jgi:hypothetical protein
MAFSNLVTLAIIITTAATLHADGGVVAVPVMVTMTRMAANSSVMGRFPISDELRFTGWHATPAMTFAALAMVLAFVV